MLKSDVNRYAVGSAEYVVAHAAFQHGRGRGPAMAYNGLLNPQKALAAAQAALGIIDYGQASISRICFAIAGPPRLQAFGLFRVDITPDTQIGEAISEVIILAHDLGTRVLFNFNGDTIEVGPDSDPEEVYLQHMSLTTS